MLEDAKAKAAELENFDLHLEESNQIQQVLKLIYRRIKWTLSNISKPLVMKLSFMPREVI